MKKALLIIDAQNFFMNEYTRNIPRKIAHFVKISSFDFILFFKFVNSRNSNFVKLLKGKRLFSPPDTDIVSELKTFTTKRNVFEKSSFSAFKSKKFIRFLKENQISNLFICGFDTDGCVMSTAIEAFDLGFDVKVLVDLCASHHGKDYHENAIEILRRNAKTIPVHSSEILESTTNHTKTPL